MNHIVSFSWKLLFIVCFIIRCSSDTIDNLPGEEITCIVEDLGKLEEIALFLPDNPLNQNISQAPSDFIVIQIGDIIKN